MDYLKNQIIAYIGNKRRLLNFIESVILKLEPEYKGFLDLFAGSSSVSRLAKKMGFSVYSNDWEFYSYVINKAYIEIDKNNLDLIFKDYGGIDNVLNLLNSLEKPKEPYISKYYSPTSDNPDPKKERMFYTKENGIKIDAIREWIEENFKEWKEPKFILVSLLLYEAATHTNTSGVFKAYHAGFGGHGKDALKRILSPIHLERPVLYHNLVDKEYKVFQEDANRLVKNIEWDKIEITYLDPPYNQHQYGSNYHLLNTIALWDKPPIDNEFKNTGKSGIRKDWLKTKSDYCIKDRAIEAFQNLIENIKSRYIMVSYNTEGIIPLQMIVDILKKKGEINLYSSNYTKYRGGKQSIKRKIKNIEFILTVDTLKKGFVKQQVYNIINQKKIESLKELAIDIKKLENKGWEIFLEYAQKDNARLILENRLIIKDFEGSFNNEQINDIEDSILPKDIEIIKLININPKLYKERIINSFNKLNHKKYRESFIKIMEIIKDKIKDQRIERIIDIAKKRGVILN
ncbi:MAG TPA: DNA adenine methylase [Spirochaetota bacterium]|nr:DNA adenine methylase [Spirochaetota bacterium]HOM37624.1 DNA adenine methylase [Spirochaetota bacterium]HPQ49405.1 DNA adenine methylase [Spirochaetota bacterium]